MKVRSAINTSVVPIRPDANLLEAAARMENHDVRVLAVVSENGDPEGIVTDRELAAKAEAANPKTTRVEEAIPEEITGCYEDVELEEAVQIMVLMGIQHMPVFDRDNCLIGFLSARRRSRDVH
jgi:CBS domain-containing protein